MEFDASLLVIMGVFWATFLVARQLIFVPVMNLLEERRSRVEGTRASWLQVQADSQAAVDAERESLREAWAQARAVREEIRRQAGAERQRILGEAKDQVTVQSDHAQAELDAQIAIVQAVLHEHAEEIAARMATALVGRAS